MNIKGKMVTLRAVEFEDNELLREMLNDPIMENLVVGWSFPISSYEQEKWYESSFKNKTDLRFVIETENEGALGIATLNNIDWKNRTAYHGIKLAIGRKRPNGVGQDAIMATMRYAFEELGLNRLEGSWFDDNEASKRVYTKCGWVVEGVKKECIFKHGKYRDLSFTRILKSEYEHLVKETCYWD